jgi:hypothetical protein
LTAVAAAGAVLALCGAAFAGWWTGFSVGLGAALAVGNLWVLARSVVAILPEEGSAAAAQSRVGWAVVAALKTAALLAISWLLITQKVVAALPMVIGFMALPIGIAIGSLVSDRSAAAEDS